MKPLKSALVLLFISLFALLTACEQPGGSRQIQSTLDGGDQSYDDSNGSGASEPPCPATRASIPAGIVGGQAVEENSWLAKGIVFLTQEYQVDRDTRTSICTATLIDQNIILTAAHCVDRARNNVARLSVYFTYRPECDSQHGTLHRSKKNVAEVRIHPFWNPADTSVSSRGDVALIRIYGKAPSSYRPMKLTNEFITLSENLKITVAGYGMTNPDYYGDFGGSISLRVAEAAPITAAEKNYLVQLTDDWNEFNNSSSNEMIYIDQSRGKGVCGGDSGGPSFLKNAQGEHVVTGVASFVMNPHNSNRLCGYVAAHTSTFYHRAWIESTFRQMRTLESIRESPYQ